MILIKTKSAVKNRQLKLERERGLKSKTFTVLWTHCMKLIRSQNKCIPIKIQGEKHPKTTRHLSNVSLSLSTPNCGQNCAGQTQKMDPLVAPFDPQIEINRCQTF